MKKDTTAPYIIRSISELHRLFAIGKPHHPLVSVIDFELLSYRHSDVWKHFANDFYCITIKKGSNGAFKYGQREYDFSEGMMTFTRPGQVFSVKNTQDNPVTGYMLVFKADFIRPYPLGKQISNYSFFSYSVAEALHLSDKEETIISSLLRQMQEEIKNNIDQYSQDVIVSHLELLLSYSNRFYNRQFLTRKAVNNDLVARLEQLLDTYFESGASLHKGLPGVEFVAGELNISAGYLSDLLRSITGQNTQQYLQHRLIEKSRQLLSTSTMTVSEIAYQLGFGYSQSFSKLFKKITSQTPIEYRQSFS